MIARLIAAKAKQATYRRLVLVPIVVLGLVGIVGTGSGGGSGSNLNVSPVASDACASTAVNTALAGDLNANVSDPDSPILSFSLVSQAIKGFVTLDVTGAFTYDPNPGALGMDSFTFLVEDLSGAQDSARVTVLIGGAVRIMPLGDSITSGESNGQTNSPSDSQRIGYRKRLYDSLVAAGYPINFVGSLSGGASASPPIADPHHEGHDGFSDAQVAANVASWLNANRADIVLLHIGTNALNTDPRDVENILNSIDTWETNNNNPVWVLLARIIDWNPINPNVQTFNDNVQAMAQTRIAGGDKIIMVNQHDALSYPADLSDDELNPQLHPNATGYQKMADTWFNSLVGSGVLPICQ